MWEALAQMGSALMLNRHQDMFNRKAANVAFDRQNMLRNTAHQAEVQDLRKAGLNPILSVSKGGPGASTPSVAAPSGTSGGGGIDFSGASAKSAQADLTEAQKVALPIQLQSQIDLNSALAGQAESGGMKANAEALNLIAANPHIDAKYKADIAQALGAAAASHASAKSSSAIADKTRVEIKIVEQAVQEAILRGDLNKSEGGKILFLLRNIVGAAAGR